MSLDPALLEQLKRVALEGDRAKRFILSDEWKWLDNIVFKTLEDEAMDTLCKAKTDSDRLKAQQMSLASSKAKEILDRLISQGDAARLQISTQSQEDDTNA